MNASRVMIGRWTPADALGAAEDFVAVEEPLELRVSGRSIAVVMRTPGHDRELAAGFLLTEGVIRRREDIVDILLCRDLPEGSAGNVADVILAREVEVNLERLTRHVFSASSCGVCGKATIESVFQRADPVRSTAMFEPGMLRQLPGRLAAGQPGFGATGGLHASALVSREGKLELVREDVGRHNALDKVLGRALLEDRIPLHDHALLVSGRVSFELVQKALLAGVPLIAGIGAPSSLAVDCARRGGQTLIGFLRHDRMNVYSAPERVRKSERGLGHAGGEP